MTTRVTELPLRLAPVERDSFADVPAAQRSRRVRQSELVRELMRSRAERSSARPPRRAQA